MYFLHGEAFLSASVQSRLRSLSILSILGSPFHASSPLAISLLVLFASLWLALVESTGSIILLASPLRRSGAMVVGLTFLYSFFGGKA